MLYKTLGYAVWKGVRYYFNRKAPSGRVLAGLAAGAVVAAGVALALGRQQGAGE
jgi:hypothetical protein